MTTIGRRRTVPVLLGVVTGALVAVLAVVVGPSREPVDQRPDASSSAAPSQLGPELVDTAPANPAHGGLLMLPIPPPPPIPLIPLPLPPPPPPPLLTGPALQIVILTNAQRARAGCGPLKIDARLIRAAQGHSADMAGRSFFSHSNPDGDTFRERERAVGYPDPGGENIARGQSTAAEAMSDWMGSPSHRSNILDCSFSTIGVGYVADGHYWTQNFGN